MYYLQMSCPTKNVNDTHDHNTINYVLSFKVRYRRTKALSMCVSKDAIMPDRYTDRLTDIHTYMFKDSYSIDVMMPRIAK